MFLCARNRCRNRHLPDDDTVDIKDLPNRYEVQYIIKCGHSLCEKCLYMIIQSEERSYICDQCELKTTFSARAYTSIKASNLSNSSRISRLNKDVTTEIPIDAYSLGLAFCEGHLTASPVTTDSSTVDPPPTMEQTFKYSKEGIDEDNVKLKALIPPAKRNKTIPLIATMHHAVDTHAECGFSLKVLGNLERKLSKEFYQAKMRLREDFQVLHSLLQLEELKGLTKFEEIYKTRKEEFSQVERHLFSVRRSIAENFELEHDTMEKLTKKRNKLKELIPKPSRISWRNYEIADEFNYHLDDYLKTVIKDSLVLKNIEKATTLTVEVVDPEANNRREPLPLFRSPPHHIPQIPAPGSSSSSSELRKSVNEKRSPITTSVIDVETIWCKLSRVFNPNLFFVMNWQNEDKIKKLQDEIEKWCTRTYTHPPAINSLKPGSFIFVYYELTSRWTRARILEVNCDPLKAYQKNTDLSKSIPSAHTYYSSISVDVQLLDYGGPHRASFAQLRQPFDELFDPETWPYLAIKCSLITVEPRNLALGWTSEAKEFMQRFCKDYKMLLQIVRLDDGDLHQVEINHTTGPTTNNITLGRAMKAAKLAFDSLPIGGARYGRVEVVENEEQASFKGYEMILVNRTDTVLITAITNPDLFYVTRYSSQEKFHELHESLKIYFDLEEVPGIVYKPRKGQACVALDEGAFYRAEIINLLDGEKVEVQFVDFGTTKVLNAAMLRLIRNEFLEQPMQAIPCKLGDIGPIGFNWSDESVAKFQDLCFGGPSGNSHLFNLTVIDRDRKGKHIVNLRRYTGTEYISVNAALVSLKFALSTGPITETPVDTATMSSLTLAKLDDRIFKALEDFDVNGYAILKELVNRNNEAKSSRIDSYIKIRVSHWTSPDEIYCQITTPEVRSYFVCYENKLVDEFHLKMDEPVPPLQPRLEIGELVVFAQVEEYDVIWRRGCISEREPIEKEITERVKDEDGCEYEVDQDTPNIRYIIVARDFGYKKKIPRKQIYKLSSDSTYLKDGDFCIKCHLADLIPAGGSTWAQTAIEEFGDWLKKYQHDLFLDIPYSFLPALQPNSLGVDIIGRENYIPNALAQVQLKFHSFKSLVVIRGLALPTNKIDITGFDDPTEIEILPVKKNLIPFTNRKGDSVLGYIRNARAAVQRQMDNTIVKFYKEPEKPKNQSFIGIPTEIGNDMKIWFRIQRLEGPQLINIVNRSITNALKDQDQLLPFAGEQLYGRACTALFDFDQTWNRAEILYPLDEERTYVRFVDYGNEVSVTKEQLSSQVFHSEIPKLALNGFLAKCKLNAQGREAESLRKQIHQLIVDHKCVFDWANFQSLKEMRFSIIMPDGVDLVEYLLKNTSSIVEDITDDHCLTFIPPMVKDILEKLTAAGFKPSTLKFEENVYYPVVVTGTFREIYTFIQPKPITYPANETEDEIVKRNKEFLASLSSMRSEVENFETANDYKPGEAVAAQFSDYQWYRAMVLEIATSLLGKQYRVFYVDYGNTSVVEATKLKKLPTKFQQSPELFAIPARVCNIKPGKVGYWSSYLMDSMEKELSLNEHNTIVSIRSRTDPWDIEVYIADPKNPRIPVASLWKSFFENGQLTEIVRSDV